MLRPNHKAEGMASYISSKSQEPMLQLNVTFPL